MQDGPSCVLYNDMSEILIAFAGGAGPEPTFLQ